MAWIYYKGGFLATEDEVIHGRQIKAGNLFLYCSGYDDDGSHWTGTVTVPPESPDYGRLLT